MQSIQPYNRPVNMMFQSYALFPHMTVAKNIAFGLKQDRIPKADIKRRVDERSWTNPWPLWIKNSGSKCSWRWSTSSKASA